MGLGEQRIEGDRLAGQQQLRQQRADRSQFISRIGDGHLAKEQPTPLAEGAHQMGISRAQAASAAPGLAINGDALQPAAGVLIPGGAYLLQPAAKVRLQGRTSRSRSRRCKVGWLGQRPVKPRRCKQLSLTCWPQRAQARWVFVPYIIRGTGDVLLAVFTAVPIAVVLLFIYGLNTSTGIVVFNSTVQGAVPEAMRGRVFTLLDITWSAMRLLSLALGGLLVDAAGIEPLFWLGGALLGAAGVLGLVPLGGCDLQARSWPEAA